MVSCCDTLGISLLSIPVENNIMAKRAAKFQSSEPETEYSRKRSATKYDNLELSEEVSNGTKRWIKNEPTYDLPTPNAVGDQAGEDDYILSEDERLYLRAIKVHAVH